MKGRTMASRAASIMIAIGLLLSPLASVVFLVGTSEGMGPLPSDYSNGDRIIGSDYAVETWSVTSTYTMNGNLTIRAGGVVTVNGGGLVFAENIGSDNTPGTDDDRVYTLIIEDGGKLILKNSTLTTNLNQLNSFPSLGVIVRNGGVLEAYDSVLSFPGHLIVDDSTLNMWRSEITGNKDVGEYCNETYFPQEIFQWAPVLMFMSSTINLFDSKLPNIYQAPNPDAVNTTKIYNGMYNHDYPFVVDVNNPTTGARESAAYYLERMPAAKGSTDNTGSDLYNLQVSDRLYYDILNDEVMQIDGFNPGGLVFSASDDVEATLHIQYYTDSGFSSSSNVEYWYRNGETGEISLSFEETSIDPVTGLPIEETKTAALPKMSSLDLYGLNLRFTNNGGQTLHINKIWITFEIVEPTYTSINLAGNTRFTAVNSTLGVDFSNKVNHNTLVLRDSSMAYLYGITIDNSPEKAVPPADRQPAFVTIDRTVEALVSSKSPNDDTGQSIGGLTSIDGTYYQIGGGKTMELNGFNTSDLNGPLSAATITLTYSTDVGYTMGNYLQWRAEDGTFQNTSIRPQNTPSAVSISFNLYNQGVKEVSDVKNLEVRFFNSDQSASVIVNKISVAMTLSPTIYIYRWANVTVTDVQSVPVSGAEVDSVLQNSGATAFYYTPDGQRTYPSDEVLQYLGRDMTNYAVTDNEGKVRLPFLSEVINEANPNPYAAYTYELMVTYVNSTGSTFTNSTGLAFNPYPDMSPANTWKEIKITMPALALELPDLVILPITLTPTTVYDGESVQIAAVIHNRGKTTATRVEVSIVGYINGSIPAFWSNQTVDNIAPGTDNDRPLTTVTWANIPKGMHTISVLIDPDREISEESKSNNVMSKQFTVLANLADLTLTSTDITFDPQEAMSGETVTATIFVNNTGRAAADNATVSLYAGSATAGGQYIGSVKVTVSAGGFVQTTFSWKPSQIGTYPVFVYVNADRSIAEYNYDNNAAFKTITVTMTIDGDALIVGGEEYPTLTISGPNAFSWAYDVAVINDGVLTISNTAFTEVQSSAYQRAVLVKDNGAMVLTGGTVLNSNFNMNVYLKDHANLTVTGSKIMSSIHIIADDNSTVYVRSSELGADLVAPETSYAQVVAQDTTFGRAWSSFGGHAAAYVTNVSIASLNAQDSAVIYHYRWVKVVVLDGTGERLPAAYVAIRHLVKDLRASGLTGPDGVITFRVLTDVRTAGMTVTEGFIGDYIVNTTYTFQGQSFPGQYAQPAGITGYSEPLARAAPTLVTLSVPGALPDLDPPIYVSTNNPVHYQNVTVSTTISNIGVVAAHNVQVVFTENGSTFYQYTIPVIQPGETMDITAIWNARNLGQRVIGVVIDPLGRINELDKTNNANQTTVTVQGIADLSVQRNDVTISPTTPARGQTSTISVRVWNTGDVDASNVLVSFYITRGTTRTLLTSTTIDNIDRGESGEASVSWTPSQPGTYTIEVIVDQNGGITEISEANNAVSFTQKVLDYADLRPNYMVLSPASPVNIGQTVSVDAAIKNIGEVAARNVTVHFYLGSTSGTPFDVQQIGLLNPDQTITVTGRWNVGLLEGGASSTRIFVVVNPESTDRINEISYTNNEISQIVTVNDLRADILFVNEVTVKRSGEAVTHAAQGETVEVSATAKNGGSTAAIAAAFYFYAVDGEERTLIGVTMKNLAPNAEVTVNTTWQINLTMGTYTLLVVANADDIVDEKDRTNNELTAEFTIDAPNAVVLIYALDQTSYVPGTTIVVTGQVTNRNTSKPIAGANVTVWLERNGWQGEKVNKSTNSDGYFAIPLYVPEGSLGDYQVHGEVVMGDKVFSTSKNVTVVAADGGGIPWYIYMIILAVIAAAIILFSAWLYKYGLGKMVECGECGALIPESSKRCPKCGVEFEVGTAKCSECGAWIPSNSTTCPECNAKFISDAIEEEEDAYLKKMREQYEAYVDTYREEAKKAMGKKYSDSKFQEWFKKQPTYVSFENWLSQEEEKRKFTGVSCPTCNTLNPRGALICHKCGSSLEERKEAPAAAEKPKSEVSPRPLRRIVRRPVEKKAVKPEAPAGEAKPAEAPKADEAPRSDEGDRPSS